MGGREFRATLLFVLISLAVGAAYRAWTGPDGPTFFERIRALEESEVNREEEGKDAAELAGVDLDSVSATSAARGIAGVRTRSKQSPPTLGRIDLDRASAGDWERLPGIGPALAARIVSDRAANGAFKTPEGLLRVRGIGPRTLERLRPFLRSAPVDSASPFAN